MKKIKYGTRLLCAVLFVVFTALSAVQTVWLFVMDNEQIYSRSEERVVQDKLDDYAREASSDILYQYLTGIKYGTAQTALEQCQRMYADSSYNFLIVDTTDDTADVEVQNTPNDNDVRYTFEYTGEELAAHGRYYIVSYGETNTSILVSDSASIYSGADMYVDFANYRVVCTIGEYRYTGDVIYLQEMFIRLSYQIRYIIYATLGISVLLALFLLVILLGTAGKKNEAGVIVKNWFDRIYLDVLVVAAGSVAVAALELISNAAIPWLALSAVGVAAAFCAVAGLLILLSLIVRIKAGGWWKTTLIYQICRFTYRCILRPIWNFFAHLWRNLAMIWKMCIVLALILFAELLLVVAAFERWSPELFVVGYMLNCICAVAWILATLNMMQLKKGAQKIAEGDLDYKIDTKYMFWEFKKHGETLSHIGSGMQNAVEERMHSEHFKTELITNVSHDIKTPLTSIINYVDLLEKEEIENPTAQEYLGILERQSARLKKLIEDLIEASKASTGALAVNKERCEVGVMLTQTVGEYEEKLKNNQLELILKKPEDNVELIADGRHLWRIFDNLMNNINKYAQPGTRVYLNLERVEDHLVIIFRNTSKYALNISGEELQERFVRGDSSRSTEGSGLGLSIARSLTELMGGEFKLVVDGDLFKVILTFQEMK